MDCLLEEYFKEVLFYSVLVFVVLFVYMLVLEGMYKKGRDEYAYVTESGYKVEKYKSYIKMSYFGLAALAPLSYLMFLTMVISGTYHPTDKQKVIQLCSIKEKVKSYPYDKRVYYEEYVENQLKMIKKEYPLVPTLKDIINPPSKLYLLYSLSNYAMLAGLIYLAYRLKKRVENIYKEWAMAPRKQESLPLGECKPIFDLKTLRFDEKLFKDMVGNFEEVCALFSQSIKADVYVFVGEKRNYQKKDSLVVFDANEINKEVRFLLDELERFAKVNYILKLETWERASIIIAFCLIHYCASFYGNIPTGLLTIKLKDPVLKRVLGVYQRRMRLREYENMPEEDKKANEVLDCMNYSFVVDRRDGQVVTIFGYLEKRFNPLPTGI